MTATVSAVNHLDHSRVEPRHPGPSSRAAVPGMAAVRDMAARDKPDVEPL